MRSDWEQWDPAYTYVQWDHYTPGDGLADHRLCRYVDVLHFCINGNFHFNLKPKHTNPRDVPLTLGAGYFTHEEDFKHYIVMTKPYLNDVSTCICRTGGY